MRCHSVKIDIDDATDDGSRKVVVIHLGDDVRNGARLVAFVEMPPSMARTVAGLILKMVDQIEDSS